MRDRKTLEEAKIIARTSDPGWLGEELYRLQEQAADRDAIHEHNARFRFALEAIAAIKDPPVGMSPEGRLDCAIMISRNALMIAYPDVPPTTEQQLGAPVREPGLPSGG